MARISPLAASALHAICPPERIPWAHSGEIPEPRANRSGRSPFQDRAMQALDLALQISESGYHVYLSGEPDLGRRHMLLSYLKPRALDLPTPPDLVYVRDFSDADSPILMALPAGQGKKFRQSVKEFVENIHKDVERRFDTINYARQRAKIVDQFQDTRSTVIRKMNNVAENRGFNLEMDENGSISLTPMIKGKRVSEDDFGKLDSSLRMEIKRRGDNLAKNLFGFMRQLSKAEESLHDEERNLEESILAETLDSLMAPFEQKILKSCPAAGMKEWLAALKDDILKNSETFLPREGQKRPEEMPPQPGENPEDRYKVNLFVDNSQLKGAPVIVEDNPTAFNLLGCIERESEMGALVTDFTLIRAGSLQKANGGFLVIHVDDLLERPAAWEGLLRALRANKSRIEDGQDSPDSTSRAKGLRPAPLDLNVKVILIGDEDSYEFLLPHEERFAKQFRIKAHMTDVAARTTANIRAYLGQISNIIRSSSLLPFDRGALAWLVDHGSHLCEDQLRLSLKFPLLRELMIEACALARMRRKDMVDAQILEDAYRQRIYRGNLMEDDFMEDYDREIIKVRTSGNEIGQVNGLSVIWNGEYEFGLPHRISCTVGVGHEGIIDLEREAELGGPIHTKAMMILKSYLTNQFARSKPLVLSASLYFEQNYAGIEGDSASGAELAALLSALAEAPVRLDLAFTGAVSHSGQIMAVGGVTRKIEGFYKVCARHGLTGSQGVIIPKDNIAHLMLAPEILASVEKGEFSIYPVTNIEEALLLLTGMAAGKRRKNGHFTPGSLFDLVDRRLESLGARAQRAFREKGRN